MKKQKKYKKIVEYESPSEYGFFTLWGLLILSAIFFPVLYWWLAREVYYQEVKK